MAGEITNQSQPLLTPGLNTKLMAVSHIPHAYVHVSRLHPITHKLCLFSTYERFETPTKAE
jgi:hypothetical protein